MKRYFLFLLLPLLAFFSIVTPALGIAYPDGQQHYYSVFLRGNGEAIVSFKAHFSNLTDQPIKSISLHVPKGTISAPSAYQVKNITNPCYPVYSPQTTPTYLEGSNVSPDEKAMPTPTAYDLPVESSAAAAGSVDSMMLVEPQMRMPCREYPVYDYNYNYGSIGYDKAEVVITGQTMTVTFPNVIMPGQDGNYFLTYRTDGMVQRTLLRGYSFIFETLKVDAPISDVQIGVSTDESYILKDANGSINYSGSVTASKAMPAIDAMDTGSNSTALATYYNQIGQGSLYKTAVHLSPMESYTLSGMYADSAWKLYGREIGVTLAILVFVCVALFVGVRFAIRRLRSRMPASEGKQTSLIYKSFHQYMAVSAAGVSFVSALIMIIFTLVLYFAGNMLGGYMPYSNLQGVLSVLVILSFVGVYTLFLLGPAIVVSVKRNVAWGIGIFALTVFWVGLFTLALFLIMMFWYRSPNIQPFPVRGATAPMMTEPSR